MLSWKINVSDTTKLDHILCQFKTLLLNWLKGHKPKSFIWTAADERFLVWSWLINTTEPLSLYYPLCMLCAVTSAVITMYLSRPANMATCSELFLNDFCRATEILCADISFNFLAENSFCDLVSHNNQCLLFGCTLSLFWNRDLPVTLAAQSWANQTKRA